MCFCTFNMYLQSIFNLKRKNSHCLFLSCCCLPVSKHIFKRKESMDYNSYITLLESCDFPSYADYKIKVIIFCYLENHPCRRKWGKTKGLRFFKAIYSSSVFEYHVTLVINLYRNTLKIYQGNK